MSVALLLARAGLRRRRGSLVALAVVLALGLGVAIASLEAAARTGDAYPSYLRRAEVGELVVNPSFLTDRVEEIIASTPGVRGYVSDSLLTATPDRGEPRTQAEVDASGTQVRLSADGRYVDRDRVVVHEGRMIGQGAEALVNVEMADDLDLHVGDMLPLAFWGNSYNDPDVGGPVEVLEPLGRTEARIVGVGVFPDEVLADGLYPRHRVLVTPDVGSRFDCTPTQPPPDDARPIEEIAATLIPPGCSVSYRYYSLRVDGGDDGVGAVVGALSDRFAAESERLPDALHANDVGFEITPTVTADERQRVQRSLAPTVRALQLFGLAAAVSTLVLVLLGAMRIARRDETDARVWRDLGAVRPQRLAAVAIPLAAAGVAGLAGAVVVGWMGSGIGPVASARAVEPAGRLGLSVGAVLAVVAASIVVLAAGFVLAAAIATRSGRPPLAVTGSRPGRAMARAAAANPPLALGVRATTRGAGGRALVGASVVAVSAVLATVVFSASLGGLVSNPERFGWPFDVGATVNYGYGSTSDQDAMAATLDRPDVEHWGVAALSGGLTIEGQTVPFVAAGPGFSDLPLPVVDGAPPVDDHEIALGALTASKLDLGVGSEVLVATVYGEREATVRGIVVLPPLGPFQADRTSLGTGVLLSEPLYRAILVGAEEQFAMEPGQLTEAMAGFVGVRLRSGTDPARFLADIAGELPTWDANGAHPFVYGEPVRPATVANVAAMRAVPIALAGVLALTMAIGLTLAISVAARARRRELAVLRALGCVGRQLRATVRWQALTVVGAGLVVGVPLGLACGRLAFGAFADSLGVAPDPTVPLAWVATVVAATVVVGLLAAAGPAHRATRIAAAETLRHE